MVEKFFHILCTKIKINNFIEELFIKPQEIDLIQILIQLLLMFQDDVQLLQQMPKIISIIKYIKK